VILQRIERSEKGGGRGEGSKIRKKGLFSRPLTVDSIREGVENCEKTQSRRDINPGNLGSGRGEEKKECAGNKHNSLYMKRRGKYVVLRTRARKKGRHYRREGRDIEKKGGNTNLMMGAIIKSVCGPLSQVQSLQLKKVGRFGGGNKKGKKRAVWWPSRIRQVTCAKC